MSASRPAELDRKNPYHLSPLTNHKDTQRGVVTGGFERKQYSERVEQAFDQAFAYERPLTETFRYAHTMQHGTPEQCAELRVQAMQQEQRQADRQAAAERQAAEQRPQLATPAPGQQLAMPAPGQQLAMQPEPPRQQPVPEVEQAPAGEQKRVRGPRL